MIGMLIQQSDDVVVIHRFNSVQKLKLNLLVPDENVKISEMKSNMGKNMMDPAINNSPVYSFVFFCGLFELNLVF